MALWTVDLQGLAAIATAIGVFVAAWQLYLAKRQATTSFEDGLAREFRGIAQRIPVKALLGEELSKEEAADALDDFYHYIDLSNEQIFLRLNGRVTRGTWWNWADGIGTLLRRPAFRAAWEEIKEQSPESFQELRRFEGSGFTDDPRTWRRAGAATPKNGIAEAGRPQPVCAARSESPGERPA